MARNERRTLNSVNELSRCAADKPFVATNEQSPETKKRNFVFTGDLNAPPGTPTIDKVSEHLANVGPDFTEKTWTTKPFSYDGFEEMKLNWRLDYIFATKDIETISTEVLKTAYSDHLPVQAKIKVG